MDRVGITVLRSEVAADCAQAAEAFALAEERVRDGAARDLEAAAFQLVRCYNGLEQAALRVAKAFENQIGDDAGWHAEVMRRLTLDLPEIRPAVLRSSDLVQRAFRHLIVHAYDLVLDRERLARVLEHGRGVFAEIETRFDAFFDSVLRTLQ